jgi:hypothetical protein
MLRTSLKQGKWLANGTQLGVQATFQHERMADDTG